MKKITSYVCCLIIAIATLSGCKKDSSSSNSSNADYYFVGKISGTSVRYEIKSSSTFQTATSAGGFLATPPDTSEHAYEGGIYDAADVDEVPYVGINFQTVRWVDYAQSDSLFLAHFTTGSKSFLTTSDVGPDGVSISYEASNFYYSSVGAVGISQPASNSVNVISVEKVPAALGMNAYVNVKAEIKALLYEYDANGDLTGNTIEIDGTILVPIEKTL
ncbi:hypothetical protein BH11BAC2_BH11BAC2_05330 [soil metagenome]